MHNHKGFTLTELLTVIVIIGIIALFSWPALDSVMESSTYKKFSTYGDSMVAAAKVFVDAYEEDYFLYDEDLESDALREAGQCAHIPLIELVEHSFIKDYSFDEMTCISDASFVQVFRKKGKYKYTYYLGCGLQRDADSSGVLPLSKITMVVPKKPEGASPSYYTHDYRVCMS